MFTTTNSGLFIPVDVQDAINAEQEVVRAFTFVPRRAQKAAPGTGIGKRCYELISAGLSNSEIVAKVRDEFPTAKTTTNCINWYRNKTRSVN